MDEFLHRNLKKGNQYHSLFPVSICESVDLGKGDTDYSIYKMVDWVLEFQDDTSLIAPLLLKSSLRDTCASIHDFCFWHFQYKADQADQLLRSPACAWKQRHDGIDCKSYSIIASCLLLNLGINHYIKKVAYKVPGEYTHVYVVVPANQQTNSLKDGYFMIDGTINTLQEPYNIDEKTEFMSLSHFGLAAPQPHLNGLTDIFKKIDFTSLKKIYASIGCIGGSGYTSGLLDANVQKAANLFNQIVDSINNNIKTGNYAELANDICDFGAYSEMLYEGHHAVDAYGDWNPCSTRNLQAFQQVMLYYRDKVRPLLNAYIDKYFTKTVAGQHTYTNVGLESEGWTFMEVEGYNWTVQRDYYKLNPIATYTQIPAFEFTPALISIAENNGTLSLEQYLSTAQTLINIVKSNSNTDGGGYVVTDDSGTGGDTPKSSGSGIGTTLAIGGGILLLKYALFS